METISRPSGSSETGIILKLAMPSGMPMIVRHIAMPADHVADREPDPGDDDPDHVADHRHRAGGGLAHQVRPNGQSAKLAMRNEAMPNGIVMIRMQQITPATAYPIAIQKPQRTSQMMLRMTFMTPS